MSTPSEHNALRSRITRYQHYTLAGMIVALSISAPLFLLVGLFNPTAFFFGLISIPTLLMALPLLLMATSTPPVTVTDEGLILRPFLWKGQSITWGQIQVVKPYPLLPSPDTEVFRRALVGRKKYKPAEGLLLVVPHLPLPYRAVGFFTGEGWTPAIAFTNRTHEDYPTLARHILKHHPLTEPAPRD